MYSNPIFDFNWPIKPKISDIKIYLLRKKKPRNSKKISTRVYIT